jgi:hypothetical protein
MLHRESTKQRDASFRTGYPVRARAQRIARHDQIVGEMLRRRLLGAPQWNRPAGIRGPRSDGA